MEGRKLMAKPDGPVGVYVAVFDSEDKADTGLRSIGGLKGDSLLLDVFDHAKVVRREDGKIEVRRLHDSKQGAKGGLAVGALLGFVFPPSILVGGAVGAAGGALVSKARRHTFDRGFLTDMGEYLQPGRAAIIVITEPQHMETLSESIPEPVWETSHAFESADSASIKEWIESLPASRS
jgi:uncharacterized membrane protein